MYLVKMSIKISFHIKFALLIINPKKIMRKTIEIMNK